MNSEKNIILSKQTSHSSEKNSGKILILLETEAQVRDCLSWLNVNGRTQIIAVTPFAMYELDRQGVDYKIPEDYYNSQELYQMGIDNFRKVEDLSDLIDSAIHQGNSKVAEHNLKPAMYSFLNFKTLYDSVSVLIFQLSKIINKEKPEVIYVYDTEIFHIDANKSSPYIFFDNRESIRARLLSLDGWKTNVKILPNISQCEKAIIKKDKEKIFIRIKRIAVPLLQTQPKLYDLFLAIQKRGLTGFIDCFRKNLDSTESSPILLYGSGYNWDECYMELAESRIGPVYRIFDSCLLDKSNGMNFEDLHYLYVELNNNKKFRGFFVLNDIDFFEILKERFEFLIKRITIVCLISVRNTMEMIAMRNITAVVASTFATPVGHSIAQAAHNSGIPVITWQHGGYGAMENHPIVNYCDLINSDAHFVFGDGVVESYIQAAKRYGTELVSIGSSSLETFNKIIPNKKEETSRKKTIIYVTTVYTQSNTIITAPPPFFDTIFWRTQKSIVDVLGKHEDCSVIIKFHPSEVKCEPLKSYIRDNKFNNFEFVINEKAFKDLLQMADIMVFDTPCTTILQALNVEKPMFAYTGHIYYNEHAQRLLSKRAICCQELDEFLQKLDTFLIDNVYEPDVNNIEFLEMYGTTSKAGTARERASKELKRIIDNFQIKNR